MTVHLMCACVRVVIPYLAHTVPDPLFPTVTFVVMGFQRAEDSSHRLWPELGECVIPSSRVSPRRSVHLLFTLLTTSSFPFPLPPPPPIPHHPPHLHHTAHLAGRVLNLVDGSKSTYNVHFDRDGEDLDVTIPSEEVTVVDPVDFWRNRRVIVEHEDGDFKGLSFSPHLRPDAWINTVSGA
jgi:hypothetical protein